MSIKKTYFLIFILFIFFSLDLFAQKNEISISGFVRDSTSGEDLIGTNILLYKDSINVNQPPFRGAATNTFGFYAIPNIPRGIYFLIIRNIGYKTLVKKIDITSLEKSYQYNFMMIPENIKLKEVVVEGKKGQEINPSTFEINPDILKKLPSLSGEANPFKVLQMLPGVQVANDISSGLYIRGGSPDQTLTLVDGAIVYNPSHLGNFASTFNSDAIQSIKLIKGAFPAEYGGRLGSVLDIKLRSGTKEKEKGKVSLGLLNSGIEVEGPINKYVTYMFSGRKMYYDQIQNSFLKSNIIPRYNFSDFNGKITITSSESNVTTLSGMISTDNLYNPTNSSGIDYNIQWKNALANLTWMHINSKSLFIYGSISYIDYEFKSVLEDNTPQSTANDYYALSKLRDVYTNINSEIHWAKKYKLKVGTEIAFHDYSLIYSNFYDRLIEPTLNGLPDIFAIEGALYVQNEGKITDWLSANIGARGYYFKSKSFFSLEPRVSFKFLVNDNLSFTAAYAIAHQFLHLIIRNDISLPTDLWYPSSEKIQPSKAAQYVGGIDYNLFNHQYIFTLEGYYKSMDNLYEFKNDIRYNLGDPIENLFTVGKGESYGLELFVQRTTGKISGWIGYTLSWTRRKFDYLNAGKVFYPRYDRRHDVSLVLAYNINEAWSIGLGWIFESGQGFTLPTGQYQFQSIGVNDQTSLQFNYTGRNAFRLAPYHKLDLNVTYKFKVNNLGFETYLNIYNVYDRKNPFALYSTYSNLPGQNGSVTYSPTIKQITLFPFIPTVGITIKF